MVSISGAGSRARSRDAERLEQLPVGGAGRLAVAGARLLAGAVLRGRLRGHPAWLEHPERRLARAFDGADAERHPLRRVLQAMGLGVAPAVRVGEAARLDPHPLALEQAEHARLA